MSVDSRVNEGMDVGNGVQNRYVYCRLIGKSDCLVIVNRVVFFV